MLGLTTGFNIHSFAQKIKYTHLETAGPVSAGFSSETRAHHLEQEEDAKRENWSGLQGVQPGRGRERGAGEGSSVLRPHQSLARGAEWRAEREQTTLLAEGF